MAPVANFHPSQPNAFGDELERLMRERILAEMPTDPSGELAGKTVHDLQLIYGNWRSRWVHPHLRRPHLSSALRSSPKLSEHRAAVEAIADAITVGRDLQPHLSRGIKSASVPQAKRDSRLHRRPDLDLLISDWGIHHLHLTLNLESDGFVERTEDLLFAAFTETDAYLIGIYPHGAWALRELVEILVREWPGNDAVSVAMSGVKPTRSISEEDHLALRRGGLATFVEVDDHVVMPGLGMTTAGTPLRVTMHANQIAWALRGLRENLEATLSELDAQNPPATGEDSTWMPAMEGETVGLRRGGGFAPIADLW